MDTLSVGERSIPELVADFNSMGPANSIIAGKLTTLMLQNDFAAELGTVINNAGNDDFTPQQKLAMYKLYCEIKSLLEASAEELAGTPDRVKDMALKEVIRALFKGEIPLEGMEKEGFVRVVRDYVRRLTKAA